ncbi:MAG: type IV toxin-antitoxin system AbiEi family antitoxin domain-containing protein [bacterium]
MKYSDLDPLKKIYFTVNDLSDALNIRVESARVLCSRYVKKGIFIRLKKGFYILASKWEYLTLENFYKISNFLQVPSYISFMSALSRYEVTTQVQRNFFESASLKRTKHIEVKDVTFNFYKLNKKYYFDFLKEGHFFIATMEKALLDSLYLYSFGKYKIDINSIDFDKFDNNKIKQMLDIYPPKTAKTVRKLCGI